MVTQITGEQKEPQEKEGDAPSKEKKEDGPH